MYQVIIIDKVTKETEIYESGLTEKQALKICEMWGWFYSDENGKNYWIDYEKMED